MKKILITVLFLAAIMVVTDARAIEPEKGQVIVFDNPQCQGEPYMVMKVGEYPDLREYKTSGKDSPSWDNDVSCMKIGEGVKVRIWMNTNYKGRNKIFSKTADNKGLVSFANQPWDDAISSMKIY
jgi:hypothetical protein